MPIPVEGIAKNRRLCLLDAALTLAQVEVREMIRGIKFISVPVKNQDAALKFYTDSVGFKVKTDQEFIPEDSGGLSCQSQAPIPVYRSSRRKDMRIVLVHFNLFLSGAMTFFRQPKC
jgi:hypothetical protein